MKEHVIVTTGAVSSALALTSCEGGGSSSTNITSQYVATPNAKARVVGSFGAPMVLTNGIKYTLSTSIAFIPGKVGDKFDLILSVIGVSDVQASGKLG